LHERADADHLSQLGGILGRLVASTLTWSSHAYHGDMGTITLELLVGQQRFLSWYRTDLAEVPIS
jgi:hypothetical protein